MWVRRATGKSGEPDEAHGGLAGPGQNATGSFAEPLRTTSTAAYFGSADLVSQATPDSGGDERPTGGSLMNTPSVAYPRTRVRSRVDHASAVLLRSVMADSWQPERAARELVATVHSDRRILVFLRAKLSRAALERPTRITERAAATLERALVAVEARAGSTVLPRQGGAHA